jgi:hypothetical protein
VVDEEQSLLPVRLHYEELYLHPNPSATTETNKLWEWDVAEVFIGSDFKNIRQYKELQVSPQGEWVDLDIDRDHPKPEAWKRNSGYQVKAPVDPDQKIWYVAMKIPLSAIDRRAAAGNELRMNFYGDPEPSKGRRPAQHPDAAFLATHLLPNNQSRSRIIRKVEDAVRYSKMNMVVHDWPSRIESH